MPKSHLGHHLYEKVPFDMVKSFLDVHLKKKTRLVVFQSRIKGFVSNKNGVQNLSPLDKSLLRIKITSPITDFSLFARTLASSLYTPYQADWSEIS